MTLSNDNGENHETGRELSMESQIVLGVFVMFAFAGLIWFLFAGH
jgi:hypothetical protein